MRRTSGRFPGSRPRWDQLARYGYDLTARLTDRPEPLVDRQEVGRRLWAALLASVGGNAMLVGPPGCGKRSAIRALAQGVARGDCPPPLRDRQVYWLDARRLVSDTRFRGDLESRIARLAREVAAGRGRLIVALEHPALLVAGDSAGSAGPAVQELLGSGGWLFAAPPREAEELARAVPDWDALVETVELPGWHDGDVTRAAAGWLPTLVQEHGVTFADDTAELAVRLARRYRSGHAVPGAAVRLLDRAAARTRVRAGDVVDRTALLQAVADETGLPLAGVDATVPGAGPGDRWLDVEGALAHRVVGQPRAVRAVSAALRRARAGIGDAQRPLGSFLFLGPTGVGKTELARALAEFLFGDEEALVRVDMSEYMERHAVARLIGAPPGYVGFELPGQLTDPVRRRPFSVVLFDEAEKAHADVLNLLLQVLEDGRLTDGYGRTVDFRQTVVVLTSNAGSMEARGTGPRAVGTFLEAARGLLRPELLNRLDDVVVFDRLGHDSMEEVVELQLRRASTRLAAWGLHVSLTDDARQDLARRGYDPEYGARPLRRLIEREVLDPVAAALLAGGLDHVSVRGIVVEQTTHAAAPPAEESTGAGADE